MNKIDNNCWYTLSANPNAIDILRNNMDKIDFDGLCLNINIMQLLGALDYDAMKKRNCAFAEELVGAVFNPARLMKICDEYGVEFSDLVENVY